MKVCARDVYARKMKPEGAGTGRPNGEPTESFNRQHVMQKWEKLRAPNHNPTLLLIGRSKLYHTNGQIQDVFCPVISQIWNQDVSITASS